MGSNRSRTAVRDGGVRSRVYGAVLAVVATAVALGAAELLFRAFDLRGFHAPRTRDWEHALVPKAERLPDVGVQFAPNTSFDLTYDSNPRGYFDARSGSGGGLTYAINAHGFRGPEYPIAKPPGERRIVLIGDSFAFGEGVRFADTLGARLEASLNERSNAAGRVAVLNLGVSGAGTLAELSFLRHRGVQFEPDLVLWVYVLNDAGAGGLNVWEDFTQQYEARWLKGSYLASYIYSRVSRQVMGRRYIDQLVDRSKTERKKWNRSLKRLSEAKRVAESEGSRFAVAIFPFMYRFDATNPFVDFHRFIAKRCRDDSIPVIDLLDAFKGQTDTDLWVHPSDQHPNEIAHAIAADAVLRFVVDQGLLPSD